MAISLFLFLLIVFQLQQSYTTSLYLKFQLLAILNALIISIIVMYLSIFVDWLIVYLIDRTVSNTEPEGLVINIILVTLSETEKHENRWNSIIFKKWLLFKLEQLAKVIEKDFYLQLRSQDVLTDAWLRQTTSEISYGIREKKKWISTPMETTRSDFMTYLSKELYVAANGNWNELDKTKIDRPTKRIKWSMGILKLLRTILVAISPLLLLYGLNQLDITLQSPYNDYVIVGAILWALTTILAEFDEKYTTKVGAIKDVGSMLLGSGKGK